MVLISVGNGSGCGCCWGVGGGNVGSGVTTYKLS